MRQRVKTEGQGEGAGDESKGGRSLGVSAGRERRLRKASLLFCAQ